MKYCVLKSAVVSERVLHSRPRQILKLSFCRQIREFSHAANNVEPCLRYLQVVGLDSCRCTSTLHNALCAPLSVFVLLLASLVEISIVLPGCWNWVSNKAMTGQNTWLNHVSKQLWIEVYLFEKIVYHRACSLLLSYASTGASACSTCCLNRQTFTAITARMSRFKVRQK